jgi:hypothetical protein
MQEAANLAAADAALNELAADQALDEIAAEMAINEIGKATVKQRTILRLGLANKKMKLLDLLGCYLETRLHIVMDRNFVCLWRRHNCN